MRTNIHFETHQVLCLLIFLFAGTGTFLLVRGWRSSVAMPTMVWNTGDQTHRWAVRSIHLLTNPSLSIAVTAIWSTLDFCAGCWKHKEVSTWVAQLPLSVHPNWPAWASPAKDQWTSAKLWGEGWVGNSHELQQLPQLDKDQVRRASTSNLFLHLYLHFQL